MSAARIERRPVKLRRTGRHTTPSQVEKVAEKAGKAAPAMAIAGVLVAAPQVQHASAGPRPAAVASVTAPRQAAASAKNTLDAATADAAASKTGSHRSYDVRSGDTLSSIARHFYREASDWQWLVHENAGKVSDPNMIYPGESLNVPYDPPARYTLPSSYRPKHAAAASSDTSTGSGSTATTTATASPSTGSESTLSGTLGCSGLEQLWEDAGGSSSEAFVAAEIAMAESGGNQYATSPTDDFGYWQINAVHGAQATYNPIGNAEAAISISGDGTDWAAWTTYQTGAYIGRC